MKKVIVKQGEIALVFKNEELKKVLKTGKHWIWLTEKVEKYKVNKKFYPKENLDVWLQNPQLQEELQIVKVLDNEIALMYNRSIFKRYLETGIHLFWKNKYNNFHFQIIDMSQTTPITEVKKSILRKSEMSYFIKVFQIEAYGKGILFVDGQKKEILSNDSYYFWYNTSDIRVEKVDLRQ